MLFPCQSALRPAVHPFPRFVVPLGPSGVCTTINFREMRSAWLKEKRAVGGCAGARTDTRRC